MSSLTKGQILKADDLKREKIEVPEWGGDIYITTITGKERDSFEQSILTANKTANLKNIRAELCALTIVDESGKRIFEDTDIEMLGEKSGLVLDRIFQIAQRINCITSEEVEELAKNLEGTHSEDSTLG